MQTLPLKSFRVSYQNHCSAWWSTPMGPRVTELSATVSPGHRSVSCNAFQNSWRYNLKNEISVSAPWFGAILLLWQLRPLSNFKPNIYSVTFSPFVLVPALSFSLNVDTFLPLCQKDSHSQFLSNFFVFAYKSRVTCTRWIFLSLDCCRSSFFA